MTSCIFCRIISGDEPRHHVWENNKFLVILTTHPHQPGHSLIIPKHHVDYFFDMEREEYVEAMDIAYRLEPVLRTETQAKRIGLAVEGFGVGHAHLHMIPLHGKFGLDSKLAHDVPEHELAAMAKKLQTALKEAHVE